MRTSPVNLWGFGAQGIYIYIITYVISLLHQTAMHSDVLFVMRFPSAAGSFMTALTSGIRAMAFIFFMMSLSFHIFPHISTSFHRFPQISTYFHVYVQRVHQNPSILSPSTGHCQWRPRDPGSQWVPNEDRRMDCEVLMEAM